MEFYNHTLKAVAEGRAEMVALGKYAAYAFSCFCMIMFATSIISSISTISITYYQLSLSFYPMNISSL
jgi:magnesium-transporting ATPase (P-type)